MNSVRDEWLPYDHGHERDGPNIYCDPSLVDRVSLSLTYTFTPLELFYIVDTW
jgi:hypothetical protein